MAKRTDENKKLLANQFKEWYELNKSKLPSYTKQEQKDFTNNLTKRLIDEIINYQGTDKIKTRMMRHKYFETKTQLATIDKKLIDEVKQNIWKPKDKSDYRRIIPEMILISDKIRIEKKDIFGNISHDTYEHNEKLKQVWNILSSCVSKARNDNVPGRNLKYIVIDKISRKYLGVINIASTLPNLTPRNEPVFKTSNIKGKYWKTNSVLNNMATGQKIVATQPFGYELNGGKLLSLLCVSNQVQADWKYKYGDTLVSVDTTSLYGGEVAKGNETQYDGMRPIWSYMGDTDGRDMPFKPFDPTYNMMSDWLLMTNPKEWFKLNLAKTNQGQNLVREAKNNLLKTVYTSLKIKDKLKKIDPQLSLSSQEPRGVYLSRLYKNTDEFLRGEITEDKLKPAFNNSIDFLTELWKFGYHGDTEQYKNPEIIEMFNDFKELRKQLKIDEDKQIKYLKEKLVTEKKQIDKDKIEQQIRRIKGESKIKENRSSVKARIANNRLNRLMYHLNKKGLTDVVAYINKKNSEDGNMVNQGKKTQKSVNEKSFIDYYIRKYKLQKQVRMNEEIGAWFGDIFNMNWSQVKEKYRFEFDQTE